MGGQADGELCGRASIQREAAPARLSAPSPRRHRGLFGRCHPLGPLSSLMRLRREKARLFTDCLSPWLRPACQEAASHRRLSSEHPVPPQRHGMCSQPGADHTVALTCPLGVGSQGGPKRQPLPVCCVLPGQRGMRGALVCGAHSRGWRAPWSPLSC